MPTYNKFNAWAEYMVEGANLGSDQFAVALTNTLPTASNSVIADITQISYTGLSSRNITTTSSSQTSGAFSLVFANLTLTASASVGPFRYVVIYDDTVASDPLVGWYDLGASMSLGASESLVLQGMGLDMAGVFTPLSLYTGGYTGGWYDPSDISTLWQNSTRTTPVTADGDPVGCIDDKSGNGNHLTQATTSLKPLYKTAGGLHWLQPDGVDDRILPPSTILSGFSSATALHSSVQTSSQGAVLQGFGNSGVSCHEPFVDTVVYGDFMSASRPAFGTTTIGVKHVFRYVQDASTLSLYIDGTQSGSSASTTYASGASPAVFHKVSGALYAGKLYGLVLINKKLSSTEAANSEAFLATKAGI